MLGRAELNVTTNGILLDSFLVDVLRALLRGIWRTLSISSLMKRYLYSSIEERFDQTRFKAYSNMESLLIGVLRRILTNGLHERKLCRRCKNWISLFSTGNFESVDQGCAD